MPSHFFARLSQYRSAASLRLHMPGHGGALSPFDVTELCATDDLFDPQTDGALERDEADAARLFGAKTCLFSAGGATLCLQTALCFAVRRQKKGARVFCERGVHRSVLHALALLDVDPVFVDDVVFLTDADVAEGDLLVFSGCDYFGKIPNWQALSDFCRRNRLHSVIDNAHGTHLRFLNGGRLHPLTYGFELVVDSAHKTLSCLTSSAVLHVGRDMQGEVHTLRKELFCAMRLFGSTSPNYLVILSLCEELFRIGEGFDGENYAPFLQRAKLVSSVATAAGFREWGDDPMRIALTEGFDFLRLSDRLKAYGIFVELAQKDGMVMLFGADFDEEKAAQLSGVLAKVLPDCKTRTRSSSPLVSKQPPRRVLSLREALMKEGEEVKKAHAAGRIAAEVVGLYPPGTALCMPGEDLTGEVLDRLTCTHVRVVK